MTADRPALGISLMIVFCALAPLSDAFAKLVGASVPLIQMLAVRFAAQGLLLLPVVWATGRTLAAAPRVMGFIAARTVFHIVGSGFFFMALRFLPIADVVAISFVLPLIMLILGHDVLGEEVGWRRAAACGVGFVGTLMVVQPSFISVGWPAFLPLVAIVAVTFGQDGDVFGWRTPGTRDGIMLAAVCVTGTLAHLILTWSFRYAPAATLAPMQYLEIPFATLLGLLIFGDFPNGLALVGIVITMTAGLYIVFRERRAAVPVPPEA